MLYFFWQWYIYIDTFFFQGFQTLFHHTEKRSLHVFFFWCSDCSRMGIWSPARKKSSSRPLGNEEKTARNSPVQSLQRDDWCGFLPSLPPKLCTIVCFCEMACSLNKGQHLFKCWPKQKALSTSSVKKHVPTWHTSERIRYRQALPSPWI